ncbi:MAG TPA: alpha/beta hydrolase family protein [Terriglobia bacterium]|nr:alpha/beta hydrolase family protein [Terriglobia bacterium]
MSNAQPSRFSLCFLLAALCAATTVRAVAQEGAAECRTVASKILNRPVRYCALLPPRYSANSARRFPVVYFLHGLGGNEQWLLTGGGWELIEQMRRQNRIGEFVLVTPDAGRTFYINSRDGSERYEDFFLQEFVPAIETRYRAGGARAARGVGGISMGGYGALRFAFRHPQMFAAVAVHSAALLEDLPADTTLLFGRNFRAFGDPLDRAYWRQNTPLALARTASGLARLRIYLDCGLQDDYGFQIGARRLHEILERRGTPHEFHLHPGGHNWEYFSEHLDDSLAFLSRALGLQ